MIVTIMLIGELSVAVLALPALPSTFSTSGTDLMILSCTCNIRFTSELETSGSVTGIKRIEPSSKGGMNSRPRLSNNGILINKAIILTAIVVFLQRIQPLIMGSYILSSPRLIGFADSGRNLPFMKNEINTGARVITKRASTIMMKVLVYASG